MDEDLLSRVCIDNQGNAIVLSQNVFSRSDVDREKPAPFDPCDQCAVARDWNPGPCWILPRRINKDLSEMLPALSSGESLDGKNNEDAKCGVHRAFHRLLRPSNSILRMSDDCRGSFHDWRNHYTQNPIALSHGTRTAPRPTRSPCSAPHAATRSPRPTRLAPNQNPHISTQRPRFLRPTQQRDVRSRRNELSCDELS